MKRTRLSIVLGIVALTIASGCAPEPVPRPIYAEPVFDKYGNPDCRPIDTPIGGAYTVDLPICPQIGTEPQTGNVLQSAIFGPIDYDNGPDSVSESGSDTDDEPDTPDDGGDDDVTPPDDEEPGNQNRNRNQNQNQNRQSSGS
ncbi:hypothetical protein [Yoonia sediminilitoris]|uniref:Uncharacterized protein n=1 Tax=Yoonia sediminilitoris TaxID=1286148 RepID=A0A2T6KR27_9RHOB|nr:hypothetical protein [Yoonia sediminilitoris]PUB19000.1 hypothetical protein C8N45_101591 [Yoonia sediminilitoris]RCW99168.1 hypothetical protein DFP92_101591 [Yoonia sediminilitoris]